MATKKFIMENVFYNAQFNDDYTIITDVRNMNISDIMKHMHADGVKRILMNNKTYYDFEFIIKTLLTKGVLTDDTIVNLHIDRDSRAHEDLTLDTPDYILELGVSNILVIITDKNTGTCITVKNRTQLKNQF